MGCSESRESTPVLIFTPSSLDISSLVSDDQLSEEARNRNEGVGSKNDGYKTDIDNVVDQVENDEIEEQQKDLKKDNISISSKTSNDQKKINSHDQEKIDTTLKSEGNEDTSEEVKTKASQKSEDKLTLDLQMSLKNILIKAEKKKKQLFALRGNKSDEATIHLNRSFCDTAPVSPVVSKEQVEAKASNEEKSFWDDEPIETAETDTNDDHSPW